MKLLSFRKTNLKQIEDGRLGDIPQSLAGLSRALDEKLLKFPDDTFDFDVPNILLPSFKRIVTAKKLEWSDPGLAWYGNATIVIGPIGADFDKHEKGR